MAPKKEMVRALVDAQLKRDSEDILRQLGLSQTEAIRMFFAQIVRRRGLPFDVVLHPTDDDDILLPRTKRQAAIDSLHESAMDL